MAKSHAYKAYASQVSLSVHLDERSQRILEKAKKYDNFLHHNQELATVLLRVEPKESPSQAGAQSVCEMLMWMLEAEASIQMSKE